MSGDSPNFDILINGTQIRSALRSHIVELRLDLSLENTGKLKINIGNFDGFDITMEDLKLRSPLSFWVGYGYNLLQVFDGEIVRVYPAVNDRDVPVLTIEALDRSYLLKRKPIPYIYTADKFSDLRSISEFIVKKHDLGLVLDPADKIEGYKLTDDQSIEQDNETDWEMLNTLARTDNLKLFCSGYQVYMVGTDFLRARQSEQKIFEFFPSDEDIDSSIVNPIREWDAKLGADGQREKAEVINWKPVGTNAEEKTEASDPQTEGEAGYTDIKVQSSTIETIRVKGNVRSKQQAKALVEAELQRRADNIVIGKVKITGDATINIGDVHLFRINAFGEIGRKYSGQYHITDVGHQLSVDGGFVTDCKLRRNGLAK